MYDLIIFVVLLMLGYLFGNLAERRHYRSIRKRESELNRLPAIATRIPPTDGVQRDSQLVAGSVVISVDFFRKFVAGLRNLIGGRVVSYEGMIDRARREAILRMKQEADVLGADLVFNIKIQTASISQNARGGIGSVEVLAYGTALIPR